MSIRRHSLSRFFATHIEFGLPFDNFNANLNLNLDQTVIEYSSSLRPRLQYHGRFSFELPRGKSWKAVACRQWSRETQQRRCTTAEILNVSGGTSTSHVKAWQKPQLW